MCDLSVSKEIITSRQIDGGKWEPKIKETRKENSQGLTRVAVSLHV
jgi:hypothetical protein